MASAASMFQPLEDPTCSHPNCEDTEGYLPRPRQTRRLLPLMRVVPLIRKELSEFRIKTAISCFQFHFCARQYVRSPLLSTLKYIHVIRLKEEIILTVLPPGKIPQAWSP